MVAATCMLVTGITQASPITWTTSDIVDINDVVTTGTLVEAINARGGASTAKDVVVAGVYFTGSTALANNNFAGETFSFDTGDANYNSLLGSIDYGTNSQSSRTYTFTGLTEGQSYIVQFWYADGDGSANARTMTLKGTGDNVLHGNDYAMGTFTADSTTQALTWKSSESGIRVNAIQLRTVAAPALGSTAARPSSAALLSIGTVTLKLRLEQ